MAQVIGEKGEKYMLRKKIKYTDGPVGKVKIINDFLPTPDELVLKEETIKVTLSLTKESVKFFKYEAERRDTHYQTMIRVLLDEYSHRFSHT